MGSLLNSAASQGLPSGPCWTNPEGRGLPLWYWCCWGMGLGWGLGVGVATAFRLRFRVWAQVATPYAGNCKVGEGASTHDPISPPSLSNTQKNAPPPPEGGGSDTGEGST